MGRNAAKELARITGAISRYVDRAEEDPELPLTYEAIERATGVSRGHLSRRKEPEITALVQRIARLRDGRRDGSTVLAAGASQEPAPAAAGVVLPGLGASTALPDLALAAMIQRDLQEIARLQTHWTGRHARVELHDAPLALHDADELLRRLRAAVERVRPLVGEWTRRRSAEGEAVRDAVSGPDALF